MGLTYTINKHINLKLENGKTVIYVCGEELSICRVLPINIPQNDIQDIQSVDDLLEMSKILKDQEIDNKGINAETEFLVNCSNLQCWVENRYNTDLMDSIIAFPILRRLVEIGDKTAKMVFKEEIMKRYKNSIYNSRQFLKDEGFLDYFTEDELIIGALETRECNLFYEIVDFMKKYGVTYELVLNLDEDKCRHRTDPRKRFFSLHKGHICEFEFDLDEESFFLFEKFSRFKGLTWLVLSTTIYYQIVPSGNKISSLRVLKILANNNSEIPNIFNMIPNVEALIIRNQGTNGIDLEHIKPISDLEQLKALKIWKYNYNIDPDDLHEMKSRGIKILIKN